MDVILLERISRLGGVGDVVRVRDGFARNYLIPQKKALRASKENRDHFESQRSVWEKQNAERKQQAQEQAKEMEGLIVAVVRQASDDGKLYGSVSVRDVADAMKTAGYEVDRRLIDLNTAIKKLGGYTITVNLHPEVPVNVKVHVARNSDSPLPPELQEPAANKGEAEAAQEAAETMAEEASGAAAQGEQNAEDVA